MAKTFNIPEDQRENVQVGPDGRVYFEYKKAQYIELNGVIYPYGLEPDLNVTPEELRKLQHKEDSYGLMMRIGCCGVLIFVVLGIGLAIASHLGL